MDKIALIAQAKAGIADGELEKVLEGYCEVQQKRG